MQIKPGLIGFDIDGVVANTCEAFLRIAAQSFGYIGLRKKDIIDFDVAKCLPIPKDIVDEIFDHLMKDPIAADMKPMPHAVNVLTKMANHAPITFITARPLQAPIIDWLQHVLPESAFSKVQLVAMGDHNDKARYIRRNGLDFFVDDRAETCLALEKEGITPLVYRQPWNAGKHNLSTVDSWRSIEKKIRFS